MIGGSMSTGLRPHVASRRQHSFCRWCQVWRPFSSFVLVAAGLLKEGSAAVVNCTAPDPDGCNIGVTLNTCGNTMSNGMTGAEFCPCVCSTTTTATTTTESSTTSTCYPAAEPYYCKHLDCAFGNNSIECPCHCATTTLTTTGTSTTSCEPDWCSANSASVLCDVEDTALTCPCTCATSTATTNTNISSTTLSTSTITRTTTTNTSTTNTSTTNSVTSISVTSATATGTSMTDTSTTTGTSITDTTKTNTSTSISTTTDTTTSGTSSTSFFTTTSNTTITTTCEPLGPTCASIDCEGDTQDSDGNTLKGSDLCPCTCASTTLVSVTSTSCPGYCDTADCSLESAQDACACKCQDYVPGLPSTTTSTATTSCFEQSWCPTQNCELLAVSTDPAYPPDACPCTCARTSTTSPPCPNDAYWCPIALCTTPGALAECPCFCATHTATSTTFATSTFTKTSETHTGNVTSSTVVSTAICEPYWCAMADCKIDASPPIEEQCPCSCSTSTTTPLTTTNTSTSSSPSFTSTATPTFTSSLSSTTFASSSVTSTLTNTTTTDSSTISMSTHTTTTTTTTRTTTTSALVIRMTTTTIYSGMVATLSFRVGNVDFQILQQYPKIMQAFEDVIKHHVADAAGVSHGAVDISLYEGGDDDDFRRRLTGSNSTGSTGVATGATANVSGDDATVQDAHAALNESVSSGNLSSSMAESLAAVPNITTVTNGSDISVSSGQPVLSGGASTPPAPTSFSLIGDGTCLNQDNNVIVPAPGRGWNSNADACSGQCIAEPLCIGYMTDATRGCLILLVTDEGGQGGVQASDPSVSGRTCWQKIGTAGMNVVQFSYDMDYSSTDMTEFQRLFLANLETAGFDITRLTASFREGSIIASVTGPATSIDTLSSLGTSRLQVLGTTPTRITSQDQADGPLPPSVTVDESAGAGATLVVLIIALGVLVILCCCCGLVALVMLARRQGKPPKPDNDDRTPLSDQEREFGISFQTPDATTDEAEPNLERDDIPEVDVDPLRGREIIIEVVKEKGQGSKLGIEVDRKSDGMLYVTEVSTTGAVPTWNKRYEDRQVRVGDHIIAANNYQGDPQTILRGLQLDTPQVRLQITRKDWGVEQKFEVNVHRQRPATCICGNTFYEDSKHCRICGTKRPKAPGLELNCEQMPSQKCLKIRNIKDGGLITAWNEEQEKQQVRVGDRIVKVNGRSGSAEELEQRIARLRHLQIRLEHQVASKNRDPFWTQISSEEDDDVGVEPQNLQSTLYYPEDPADSGPAAGRAVGPLGELGGGTASDRSASPPSGAVRKRPGSSPRTQSENRNTGEKKRCKMPGTNVRDGTQSSGSSRSARSQTLAVQTAPRQF